MARFEAFWDVMCDYMHFLWLGIMVLIFLMVLTIIGLVVAEPAPGSFYVAMMNVAMILATGAVMGWMFSVCYRREREPY